jgi:hypothetical protein
MAMIGAIAGIAAAEVLGLGFFTVVGVAPSPAMFGFLAILGAAAGASARYVLFR